MKAKILSTSLLFVSLASGALSAACSSETTPPAGTGGTTGSGGASGDDTVPSDTTEAGLEAFLAAGSYKSAPWVFDAEPRPTASPHQTVRVFFNPTAVTSITDGDNDFGDDPGNALGSMAVKEIYDTAGTIQGKAILLRTASTGASSDHPSDWLYYCSSTSATCTGSDAGETHYGDGNEETVCSTCHGGSFIADLPP